MLQINLIRQSPDLVKERLQHRNFPNPEVVDKIVQLDEEIRRAKADTENMQASINQLSKETGALMARKLTDEAASKKNEVAALKDKLNANRVILSDSEKDINNLLLTLPNLPHASVPAGKAAADNEVVREGGTKPELYAAAKPHWDLIREYSLVDFETGSKLAGSGFHLYKGKGAKLQRALIQYFLDKFL